MKAKHTPGPWKVGTMPQSSQTAVRGARGGLVCALESGYQAMRDADARLIAAAPELLAKIEALSSIYSDGKQPLPWADRSSQEISEAWAAVRAAIAEARGQS